MEEKTWINFPNVEEMEKMSVKDLTDWKQKIERLAEFIKNIIRRKLSY